MNTNFCCETSNETQLLARIWNERLGKLIKKNFGTQKEFAQKFKRNLWGGQSSRCQQVDKRRNLISERKNDWFSRIPNYEKNCDFFQCDRWLPYRRN